MNKVGRGFSFLGRMSLSQAIPPRFGKCIGLTDVVLLLVFALTLSSCENTTREPNVIAPSSTDPVVTAPANIVVAATDASGTAASDPSIVGFLAGASAFDTEDGAITTITNDGPAVFPPGVTTVTFSATDSDGNTDTAQATVTVADQTAPLITLLGAASITLNVGDPFTDPGATANDNVDGDLTLAIVTGGAVNTGVVGLYTLTYDVTDAAGNAAAQVTRGVSVQTGGTPVVTPPLPITVAAVDATGTPATDPAIVIFLAGASATDPEDGPIVTITNDAPAQFPLGATTVTFSATDSSSNTGQAQATVTVSDQAPPLVTAPANIMVAATGPGGIAASDPAIDAFLTGASATDNVDGAIATISNNAPTPLLPVGVTTVTFSAIDAAGNTGTAQATVTVTPFVSVQMVAFSRDVGGQLDLFAIAEDGSGSEVTLASDPGDEVFGGSTSNNRVIYVRDVGGGLNDIFSINDDGSGVPVTLTNDANDELPVAVTAANRVIFMRSLTAPGPHSDLLSINADGSGGEVPLATTVDVELFGGLTSDGRVVYDRADALLTQSDVYSIFADGSGGTVPLAATAEFEAGGGIAAGNVVVFARTVGGLQNDIFTIDADGLSAESPLVATADDELPVGVTASDLVIFMRTTGFTFNLLSVGASGTPVEAQLAAADGLLGDFISYGGSTGGRVIYNICNFISGNCDVFSRNADGTGLEATLAADPVEIEVIAGVSSDGLVIIVRDNGVTTDLISINADGSGGENLLATAPTPVPPDEVFKGVTANGRVIFERTVSGQTDLFSILADGSAAEVPLATTPAADESFGGVF